ncbi:hypothetical protein Cob_v003552 [Colletotrichum orbiculare MAFF 240422]|uniref:Uncharacterized protein n=1 Tax=Colletotrichum orbiculare (strain 104-T / ATCC 96160 / CBS 514.97 / LARS 414 / MAFF 240422) TaxID=1213857 RepID=A0A484G1D2_COLOR|nr:hypothetical protein Cob_v003552 [Colletotrichum orbiculare MAFF 240422]
MCRGTRIYNVCPCRTWECERRDDGHINRILCPNSGHITDKQPGRDTYDYCSLWLSCKRSTGIVPPAAKTPDLLCPSWEGFEYQKQMLPEPCGPCRQDDSICKLGRYADARVAIPFALYPESIRSGFGTLPVVRQPRVSKRQEGLPEQKQKQNAKSSPASGSGSRKIISSRDQPLVERRQTPEEQARHRAILERNIYKFLDKLEIESHPPTVVDEPAEENAEAIKEAGSRRVAEPTEPIQPTRFNPYLHSLIWGAGTRNVNPYRNMRFFPRPSSGPFRSSTNPLGAVGQTIPGAGRALLRTTPGVIGQEREAARRSQQDQGHNKQTWGGQGPESQGK